MPGSITNSIRRVGYASLIPAAMSSAIDVRSTGRRRISARVNRALSVIGVKPEEEAIEGDFRARCYPELALEELGTDHFAGLGIEIESTDLRRLDGEGHPLLGIAEILLVLFPFAAQSGIPNFALHGGRMSPAFSTPSART